MKTTKLFPAFLMIGALITFSTSCNNNDDNSGNNDDPIALLEISTRSGAEGVTTFALNNLCPVLDVTTPLTADEIEFLFAMREDEKLTKDLYTAFATQFPVNAMFSNIATAEVNHIAAIEKTLGYYEIDFPLLGAAGVFTNTELQTKYDELVHQTSAIDAFMVMAKIEEENVVTYKEVAVNASNANIKRLLENMVRASSNHLKAAVRQITTLGGAYTPESLDQASFDTIINSAFGQGNIYQYQNGQGGKNSSTNSQKGKQNQGQKGSVNKAGDCTGTSNGTTPGSNGNKGSVGKGYRGGRNI